MRALLPSALIVCLSAAALAQGAGEQLVLPPFPGDQPWKQVTDQAQGGHWRREFVPGDQTLSNYKDILAAEAFPDMRARTPADLIRGIFASVENACEGVRVNGPVEREEGGFAVAYAQIYCGRQRGKSFGVNIFYKVIQGADALYVINRDVRVKPEQVGGMQHFSKDEMQEMVAVMQRQGMANKYLSDSVYLCGGKSTDPRCTGAAPAETH